jgi:hypothetical protein
MRTRCGYSRVTLVNRRRYRLETQSGMVESLSAEDVLTALQQAVARGESPVAITIDIGAPPARWESILYPLLGLRIPRLARAITLSVDGRRALVVFEDGDDEWLLAPSGEIVDRTVSLRTLRGERFQVDESECVPLEDAVGLIESFVKSGSRPPDERWRKS